VTARRDRRRVGERGVFQRLSKRGIGTHLCDEGLRSLSWNVSVCNDCRLKNLGKETDGIEGPFII